MKNMEIYQGLNRACMFREFKEKYNKPDMHITSYRRVLNGESTYLGRGRSPYIADLLHFFSTKLNKDFLDVAYDLIDSEFFGRKNTLLNVLMADIELPYEVVYGVLGKTMTALDNIRLCDLNNDNRQIYINARDKIKRGE